MPPTSRTSLLAAALCGALVTALCAVLPGASAQAAATNIALNRPTQVSSSETSAFAGAKAVDGSGTTRWSSAEGHDPEWISVDLGAAQPVRRLVLRWEAAYAKAYRVEVSTDGTAWTTAYTTTAGDGGVDDLMVNATARHVRVYGTQRATAYGYSLWELEVYGDDTGPPPTGGNAVPFGSHTHPYVTGTLRPSGAQSTIDQAVVRFYTSWKSAFVKQNCGNGWYEV